MYFTFTTLATVGYGDYTPKNNTEFLVWSFVILFGVMMFSFVMGNFMEMINNYTVVTAENEDYASLSSWFGLLARYNKGHSLPKEMLMKIESYFNDFWADDHNYAIKTDDDKRFMSELPKNIKISVRNNIVKRVCLDLQRLSLQRVHISV